MSGLLAVGYFLFVLFFSLLTFLLWARIALRYVHVSAVHPVSQSINILCNPIVTPLTRLFPPKKGRANRYDWHCFLILVGVELLKFIVIGPLFLGAMLSPVLMLIYTIADLIVQPCNLLFYAILIRVIMSWVNPRWQNPLADVLQRVTEPVLKPARQAIPIASGIDFSPFVVMIILKVITLFITASLPLQLI